MRHVVKMRSRSCDSLAKTPLGVAPGPAKLQSVTAEVVVLMTSPGVGRWDGALWDQRCRGRSPGRTGQIAGVRRPPHRWVADGVAGAVGIY